MHGICICVFITRSACTSCTLLSYICYRYNLSTKMCQQEVGHCTELERERVACSTAAAAPSSPTSSHSTDSSHLWNAQHSSLSKPLGCPNGWTGDCHLTTAGIGWSSWHWHHGCSVRLWCPSRAPISQGGCIPIWNAVLTNAAAVLADEPEDGHDASQHHARLQ